METTERAQVARIRRLLAHQGEDLRKYREDSRWFHSHGPYAVVNLSTNTLIQYGISDLDRLEAELRTRT